MSNRKEQRERKLEMHCATLADIIVSIRPIYTKAGSEQKALIETMIGAAIWYIPKPSDAWTGKISTGALKMFHPDSGVARPKFSEEHVYPRKVAAQMLLEDQNLDGAIMVKVFREKYGRLHYITSEENKSVQPYQRVTMFSTPDDAYARAGIELNQVAQQDLRFIKKRDRNTIERYITNREVNKHT